MADFKCINLECENFNRIDIIAEYYISFNGNDSIFKDKNKQRILCPYCKQPYIRLKVPFEGFSNNISTFNSKSPQEKREILKKRANAEFNRNKSMRDYKDAAWREEV